jgi:hypothetical protein
MKNIVLFRLQGEDTLWLADLDAGTVEPTDGFGAEDSAAAPRASGVDFAVARTVRADAASHHMYRDGVDFAVAANARSDSASHHMYRDGVDVAVAANARSDAASHHMYPSRAPRLDGVDVAVAASARSDAASHHMYRDGA